MMDQDTLRRAVSSRLREWVQQVCIPIKPPLTLGTEACLPMAMAGFDSIGQKPEPVKAVCLDAFLPDFPMEKEEGAGRKQKTRLFCAQRAERCNKHHHHQCRNTINAPVS